MLPKSWRMDFSGGRREEGYRGWQVKPRGRSSKSHATFAALKTPMRHHSGRSLIVSLESFFSALSGRKNKMCQPKVDAATSAV